MLKIVLEDTHSIHPFNERARDLRIQNVPLWLLQRDVLAPYVTSEREIPSQVEHVELPKVQETAIVYRDNLHFDHAFIKEFIERAKKLPHPSRVAFAPTDPAFREHALPLSKSYTPAGGLYLADLWYYPNGYEDHARPLIIDLQTKEAGYYHVPAYMASEQGDLTFQVPLRSLLAIDSWVHIFIADMVFGLFSRGARFEERLDEDPLFKMRILGRALWEGKQVLSSSPLVQIGKNCVIDPSAIIHGPTTIGDNVTIGAGVVIDNCLIGSNVNISQGCELMLSVIGDGAFLPFRAALFMTTIMDNSMVAQNTCLQMCVIGRNTFVGTGSTFTDFNLLPLPIRALNGHEQLSDSNRPVLGGCVGHNCRLGAGIVVSPARTIESDVVIISSDTRRVITRDVRYEDSDHHGLRGEDLHPRLYPRLDQKEEISW